MFAGFKKKKGSNLNAAESKKAARTHVPEAQHDAVTNPSKKAPKKTIAAPKKGNAAAYGIILRPRFTEKAAQLAEHQNAYAFEVGVDATKQQVKEAMEAAYKVTPVKIAMVKRPAKKVRSRKGKPGIKSGGKKAYVYLKKGDTIELV